MMGLHTEARVPAWAKLFVLWSKTEGGTTRLGARAWALLWRRETCRNLMLHSKRCCCI